MFKCCPTDACACRARVLCLSRQILLSDRTKPGVCQTSLHLLPAQCRGLPIGKLAAHQPARRQCFRLCSKRQAAAQSRHKGLVYQRIGSMQHHVAITVFHLHHPAFQLIAVAGSTARTARQAYRHNGRYTYLYHNKHQLHKFRSVMGRIRLPLPHRVEVRTHHQSSWYHLFLSAQNHVRR